MKPQKYIYLSLFLPALVSLACSISSLRQGVNSIEQTAQSVRTKVSGIATTGGSIIGTSRAIATSSSGLVQTVRAITTQGEPIISTIQAVATDNPGLVQTAQAVIKRSLPSGNPPADIPILPQDSVENYYGSSQYIFYTTPLEYTQVLEFYKSKMPDNNWQYLESDSNEYANAAHLVYFDASRIATIDLAWNSLNNSTVVIISIITH